MKKKALVAMSGGVDSSVCAYLAIKAGYECIGATMILCGDNEKTADATDAKKVCDKLGIKHYTFDFREEFKNIVIDDFIKSYESGYTPNPCIMCNKYFKFGILFEKARELGCEKIVTGHYARIDSHNGYALKKAKDLSKDQSYVLWSIKEDMLEHIYFPLGEITKEEARAIAKREGFVTAHKSDSQDICFVPDGDYVSVITGYTKKSYPEGCFRDTEGNILGTHRGIIHYTIGQRKGLGIAFGKPMYVKDKNAVTNDVVLCTNEELFSRELVARDYNILKNNAKNTKAKIRYNQKEQMCKLYPMDNGRMKIEFSEPQRAIALGQSVVVYEDDRVVGGGIIE